MNVILSKSKRSILLVALFLMGCLQLLAQSRMIQGEVTDAQNGEPLIGATVMVEGEKSGTVTDFDGNFKLQVTSSAKKVKISYIGYIDKVVEISDRMKVKLESDSQILTDVVVIGYGTARKSDLTGSVATVSSKDFNKGLVSSPEQLINGKVSGVQIMSNSGSASAGSTIRVRGGASLNASNDPLIVLDGVPLEQGGISGNSSNFLSMINPADIESMTVLKDASSRFSKNTRWGTFPSVALGWTLTEEPWLKDNKVISNLKLRASYGITGQQEGIGNYNYLPVYTASVTGAEALINGHYITTYRPESYVGNLKWETTTSWNFGLDFGFLDGRIGGAIDFYTRKTKDLLASVPPAAGSTFSKTILTNVGNVDSKGIEVSLNATPIQTKDWEWNLSYNFTWQNMKVKNLSLTPGGTQTNVKVGPSIDAYQFQVLSEGYEPYMFYVYHQLYDPETGKPIEGAYADLNNDGEINDADLYRYHSPAPKYIMGLSTSLRYKQLTLGMSFRANIDNYVYNGMGMSTGAWETVSYNNSQLNNLNTSFLKTGFKTRQYLSDYYVENASFLKLDNLSLSYNVGKINKWASLTVSAMVQNVFTITGYSGTDPEVPNGMDNSFYPRPRTYSVSLGLQF